ncbi:MAG: acetyl-CoA acetyltransferase [Sphingobium sp.]
MANTDPMVVGIGRSAYSRNSGRTTAGMAVEACRKAVADAGMELADIDGMVSFAIGDSAHPLEVAQDMGLPGLRVPIEMSGGGNMVTLAVAQACAAVRTGMCKAALVFRSLNSRSGKRFGTFEGNISVGGDQQYGAPQGYLAPGQWFAMYCQRYMHELGTTHEDLGRVAITTRAHAVPNEAAILRKPLTMDDYLAARWIYEPFRLFDCALEADGACAILVTTRERARDLARHPVAMLDQETFMSRNPDTWSDMTRLFSAHAAPPLWERTGLGPKDMDLACIYDCFTFTTVGVIEDYGFCEKGGTGDYYAGGRATYGGDCVINPHGGLLSEAYIHGMNHHYEAVLQLRGDAGVRQVPDAQLALVTAGTGPYGGGLIYARN